MARGYSAIAMGPPRGRPDRAAPPRPEKGAAVLPSPEEGRLGGTVGERARSLRPIPLLDSTPTLHLADAAGPLPTIA